jgi:hypothetical protein
MNSQIARMLVASESAFAGECRLIVRERPPVMGLERLTVAGTVLTGSGRPSWEMIEGSLIVIPRSRSILGAEHQGKAVEELISSLARIEAPEPGFGETCSSCGGPGSVEVGDDEGSHEEECPECGPTARRNTFVWNAAIRRAMSLLDSGNPEDNRLMYPKQVMALLGGLLR